MTNKESPIGFLVVLSPEMTIKRTISTQYEGVDRVPPYQTGYKEEVQALDDYVFGGLKDEETNLIPSYESAVKLLKRLSKSKRNFEILFCCEGPNSEHLHSFDNSKVQNIGYDVALIRGDYSSIVGDFCSSNWANKYKGKLNKHFLFSEKQDAIEYLNEYRAHQEPDHDMFFEIIFVVRILVY